MPLADPAHASPLRLLIVDADHRVRDSLAALVGSSGEVEVIGLAGHASEAMALASSTLPDVVILDPRLPEVEMGLGFISELRRRFPGMGVLVMSWTEGLEATCLELGATGFVRKSGGPNELIDAIVTAGGGQPHRVVSPDPGAGDFGQPAGRLSDHVARDDQPVRGSRSGTGIPGQGPSSAS